MKDFISILDELIRQGNELFKFYSTYPIANLIKFDDIDRWITKCEDVLEDHISTEESIRFKKKEPEDYYFNKLENHTYRLGAKLSYLEVLRNDISANPKYWQTKVTKKIAEMLGPNSAPEPKSKNRTFFSAQEKTLLIIGFLAQGFWIIPFYKDISLLCKAVSVAILTLIIFLIYVLFKRLSKRENLTIRQFVKQAILDNSYFKLILLLMALIFGYLLGFLIPLGNILK